MDLIKSSSRKKWFAALLLLAYICLTVYLFTLPKSGLAPFFWLNFPYADKLIHVGIFFLLFFFSINFIRQFVAINGKLLFILFLLFCSYGIGIEFIQDLYIEGRSFEIEDIAADVLGVLLFVVVFQLRLKKNWPR